MGYDPLTPLLRLSRPYNPSGLAPYRPPPRKFFTKCPFAMHFREIFVSRGGGQKILTRKMIYRKIFLRQNHILTTAEVKRGRWVYEGGELEHDSKNLMGCYSVFRHYSNSL